MSTRIENLIARQTQHLVTDLVTAALAMGGMVAGVLAMVH